MSKNFIKDKEKTVTALNELIDNNGSPNGLAKSVDTVLLNYLEKFMRDGECGGVYVAELITDLREVRDFFNELETINI